MTILQPIVMIMFAAAGGLLVYTGRTAPALHRPALLYGTGAVCFALCCYSALGWIWARALRSALPYTPPAVLENSGTLSTYTPPEAVMVLLALLPLLGFVLAGGMLLWTGKTAGKRSCLLVGGVCLVLAVLFLVMSVVPTVTFILA